MPTLRPSVGPLLTFLQLCRSILRNLGVEIPWVLRRRTHGYGTLYAGWHIQNEGP